jgi:DNA helicase-2/ATP-dependent DNA helicase PcrA
MNETPRPKTHEGIHVSTIHGAKGLEWDTVYLPAFEQEILPGCEDGEAAREIWNFEEERRLAYVAFTRAKTRLVISWALERIPNAWEKQPICGSRSQFIKEAGL